MKPTITITLTPEPHVQEKTIVRALRHILKRLLRNYGLRCKTVEVKIEKS